MTSGCHGGHLHKSGTKSDIPLTFLSTFEHVLHYYGKDTIHESNPEVLNSRMPGLFFPITLGKLEKG